MIIDPNISYTKKQMAKAIELQQHFYREQGWAYDCECGTTSTTPGKQLIECLSCHKQLRKRRVLGKK